jgi:hypothetical protein
MGFVSAGRGRNNAIGTTDGHSAAEPQPNRDWPQKNAKIAENKLHKSLPLSSLRSFAAKILLELRDSPV